MSSNSSYLWSVILQTVSGQVRQSFFRISLRTTHRHRTILSNHFTPPPSSPICINLHHVLYQFVISIHFWHFPIVYVINLDLFCVQSQRLFFLAGYTILHLFIHMFQFDSFWYLLVSLLLGLRQPSEEILFWVLHQPPPMTWVTLQCEHLLYLFLYSHSIQFICHRVTKWLHSDKQCNCLSGQFLRLATKWAKLLACLAFLAGPVALEYQLLLVNTLGASPWDAWTNLENDENRNWWIF